MGTFDLKKTKNGKFMFNLKARNGQIILTSEMYNTKKSAENGIASVQKNCGDDSKYDRLTGKSGKPYFCLKAGNGQVIGQSQQYKSSSSRSTGIASVKKNGKSKTINDLT